MFSAIIFFLLAFATIVTLVWTGAELFRPREDALGGRLMELQGAGMIGAGERTTPSGFPTRFLRFVQAIPGGEDWIKGSQKRLRQAGYRSERALSIYLMIAAWVLLFCLGGMLFLQRNNPGSSMLGGMLAAGIIGFIGPQFVLGKLATRYRKRLQEALPDTIDLLG